MFPEFPARSSRTEKDRARASADMQSSQKTVAQRLPHEEKIPQGNALRSIFLRPRASWIVLRFIEGDEAPAALIGHFEIPASFVIKSRRSIEKWIGLVTTNSE